MNTRILITIIFLISAPFIAAADQHRVFLETPVRDNASPESFATIPDGWVQGEPADRDQEIVLTIALQGENDEELKNLVDEISDPFSPTYGDYLSVDQLIRLTSAPETTIAAVSEWLSEFVSTSERNQRINLVDTGDVFHVKLPVHAVEKMLQTQYFVYQHKDTGMQVVRGSNTYSVPVEVAKHIKFVGGVHRFPRHPRPQEEIAELTDSTVQTTPQVIWERYNVSYTPQDLQPGYSQCVVSFLGQFINATDLTVFQKTFDLDQTPVKEMVGPNDASKPGVEASLDIDYLTGVARFTDTWIWSTPGTNAYNQEPFLVWLSAVFGRSDAPTVFSISYQDLEDTLSVEYMLHVNQEFIKASAIGKSLFTGSGDWGTQCTSDGKRFRADFPSSSPYIISAGATQFLQNHVGDEGAVTFSSGGFSNVFPQPAWQHDVVSTFLSRTEAPTSYFNSTGRGFPDISTLGVNFQVIVDGKQINVGGTSAATPTFAGIISAINSMRIKNNLPPVGHVGPLVYAAAAKYPNAFYDVTNGSNPYKQCPGFKAIQGWDAITGLGTPNFEVLREAMMSAESFPGLKHHMN
eukprot:TRINITY_DN2797_c0_g1_i1.p1 TRINITY_DN2797_c0_g1~~TRINITY_DN2797_c0_g1_i1.p1  ORF type:complete len:577 (-),score=172.75 TRINITY_DN2797_c0_g1_i1:76-1806(-)